MNSIDEILASGRYTDNRGREWQLTWFGWWTPDGGLERSREAMRLLIKRDQHRGVCVGLSRCLDHPAPRVAVCPDNGFDIWSAGEVTVADFARPCLTTFPEAVNAARALAVTP